jgi:hypothetical protein
MSAVKSLDLKDGSVLEIHHDSSPESPREWDNLGTMAVFHKRYSFGDEVDISGDDYNSWDEMEAAIKEKFKPAAILPIYMYDHSGVTINTTGFSCQWDSGQVGFIFTTQKQMDLLGVTIKNGQTWGEFVEDMENQLRGEVETMDQYISGEVYGFVVKDQDGEEQDSCWGFYGDDHKSNGILDHVGEDKIKDLGDL